MPLARVQQETLVFDAVVQSQSFTIAQPFANDRALDHRPEVLQTDY